MTTYDKNRGQKPDPARKERDPDDEESSKDRDAKRDKDKKREPKGSGPARERISGGFNPVDTGDRGPTGPAAL